MSDNRRADQTGRVYVAVSVHCVAGTPSRLSRQLAARASTTLHRCHGAAARPPLAHRAARRLSSWQAYAFPPLIEHFALAQNFIHEEIMTLLLHRLKFFRCIHEDLAPHVR